MTEERREVHALRFVAAALVVTAVLAVAASASAAGAFLATSCALAAVLRGVLRGRRPPGLAVRATMTDVAVLVALALAIGVLSFSPGV